MDDRPLLFITHDRVLCTLVKAILKPRPIDRVETPTQALSKLEEKSYALILVDVYALDFLESEPFRALCCRPALSPVVIITADTRPILRAKLCERSTVDIIYKPFMPGTLRRAVRDALEASSAPMSPSFFTA
ncbi:MAG: response regulator [Anaerolineae bacterium]|nr:response regulator [Anaerolineae bacterium]